MCNGFRFTRIGAALALCCASLLAQASGSSQEDGLPQFLACGGVAQEKSDPAKKEAELLQDTWNFVLASTRKRVATASGNNWVVLGLALPVPLCPDRILCLPLLARLHLPGKGQPSDAAALARHMLLQVQTWFPGRKLVLIGDGAYACKAVLEPLPEGTVFVGRMRGDAALYDPRPPQVRPGRRGPKPKKGPRLLSPKAAAAKADRVRNGQGPWVWQRVLVTAYGRSRLLHALTYVVVWPKVLRPRPLRWW